jgi:RNA polymerase sigma-70 factor (ECF subfamily)
MWISHWSWSTSVISSDERYGEIFPKKIPQRRVLSDNGDPLPREPMKPKEFEEFIERAVEEHESALIGYAKTFVHDLDRARDVVQDTFIRLCKQDPDKLGENLRSWLFTVCRNRCLDVLRKDRRIEPIDQVRWEKFSGTEVPPDQQAEDEERIADVMRFMDRLPKNQKEVILLKFHQGMSYGEIQHITGLTQGNIGFLIHTGLKRLREWMPMANRD